MRWGNPPAMRDGPAAETIRDLSWFLLAFGGAVYLLFLVLLLVPIARRRRSRRAPGETQTPRPEVPETTARRWIFAGGVLLPGVLLPATLAASVLTMRALPDADSVGPNGLRIEVTGYQYWWDIRYRAAGVALANELHIPVGEPVELRLTSADVIHSFWVPSLAGKVDALPDGINTLIIEADEPGIYRGACAEFCGLQHANMGLRVIAHSRADFDVWLNGQRGAAPEPTSAAAVRGKQVFVSADCSRCHTVRGVATAAEKGPELTHFAGRSTLTGAHIDRNAENLARWIADPDAIKKGTSMPAIDLDPADLAALVAYLQSLE